MENYVLHQHGITAADIARNLQSIASYSSSICRSHHRAAVVKQSSKKWNSHLDLLHLNLGFLKSITNIIEHHKSNPQQPWLLKYVTELSKWKAAFSHHLASLPTRDSLQLGTHPDKWPQNITLPLLKSKLVASIERCQFLETKGRNLQLKSKLSAIASRVAKALGENHLKSVISITGNKKKGNIDLSFVVTNNAILLDPVDIHRTCTKHFHSHHSLNSTDFPALIDWSSNTSVSNAKPGFQAYCESKLPTSLHHTIDSLWAGFTFPWTSVTSTDCQARAATAHTALSTCPTLTEFEDAIARSPASSPGISGLSFSHIKLWTPPTVKRVHEFLSVLWNNNQMIPDHWHWKLLCPIPKADKDPQALENLRPIMLVECLRKLWVGITIRRLSMYLTQSHLLSDSQHGYVAHRSSVTSGLQLLDDLDDLNSNRLPIYLSSWDFTKAFDSLPFSLSRLALQRAYIPTSIVDWLLHLDTDGKIIVRTPYALDCLRRHQLHNFSPIHSNTEMSFFTAGGGVAQGDVHSPYVWRLFIDILLRALEHVRPKLTSFPTLNTSDYGYADDIISLASSLLDLQLKADIVSAFSLLTGISISWTKLRATCQEWDVITTNPSLTVWETTDTAQTIPLVRGQTIRHLGFQISAAGHSKPALDSTFQNLKQTAAHLIKRSHWLPSQAVLTTASLQTVAQVTYTTQLSTYTSNELQTLDSQLSTVYRKSTHHWPTFPTTMLHAPSALCGLGLPSISLSTQTAKHRILQRSLHYSSLGDNIIHRYLRFHGIHPTLAYECTVPNPKARPKGASGYWLDNLLQHCHGAGLVLRRGGLSTSKTSETQLVDLYPEHREAFIRDGLVCLGDLYDHASKSWIPYVPNTNPKPAEKFKLPLVSINLQMKNLLRVGQCWQSPDTTFVFEILDIKSAEEIYVCLWTWNWSTNSLQLHSYSNEPHSLAKLFSPFTQTHRIYTHNDRLANKGKTTYRKVWRRASHPVPTIVSAVPSTSIDNIVQDINDHFDGHPIKIYTDGSWKTQHATLAKAFMFDATSKGGCSLIVLCDSPDWEHHSKLIYTLSDDGTSPTDHAYTWELLALTLSSLCQARYKHGCKLFSDCQAAIYTVMNTTPSAALLDDHAVLLYPIAKLQRKPEISHIAAHPEIHIGQKRQWTQDEKGIYLADIAASNPFDPHRFDHVSHASHYCIQSSTVLRELMSLGTWTWCHSGTDTPVLTSIKTIWQKHSFRHYLIQRDATNISPDKPKWLSRSWSLTSKVHQFSSSSITTRARLQRILLHWSGIGSNLYRDNPTSPASFCPTCRTPESEYHLFRQCSNPTIQSMRDDALLEAKAYINQLQFPRMHSIPRLLNSMHAMINSHPHGYLLFLGFVTREFLSTLPQLPSDDKLIYQCQKSIIGYLRVLSQHGFAIIDHVRGNRHMQTTPGSPAQPVTISSTIITTQAAKRRRSSSSTALSPKSKRFQRSVTMVTTNREPHVQQSNPSMRSSHLCRIPQPVNMTQTTPIAEYHITHPT